MVVVGASAAGFAAAQAVRQADPGASVVVIGDEPDLPWDRPPLSKAVLKDHEATFPVIAAGRLERLAADVRLGVPATSLDVKAHRLTLSDGAVIPYGSLVIATGVRPRDLTALGRAGSSPNLHTLRSQADAARLRASLTPGARLAVVGAGFLGLEVAATARSLGCEVTVVEYAKDPLLARLGPATSSRLLELHRDRGVEIIASSSVVAVNRDLHNLRIAEVVLDSGRVIPTDVVLVAVGCLPNVEWLEGSGLELSDGVVTDVHCQAGPSIWAAGDVAAWESVDSGRPTRVEHRANASEQGRTAGLNVVADREGAVPQAYAPVPFFWTDQYDVKIQACGHPEIAETEQVELSVSGGFVSTHWLAGELVGAMAWNAPKEFVAMRRDMVQALTTRRAERAAQRTM